jgi:hypothetical protein
MIDLPNPFAILAADPAVTDLIGDSPVRCFPHGKAPQGVAYPYVTYIAASILPINSLDSGGARADTTLVQVSIWSSNAGNGAQNAEAVYRAVRGCLEEEHDIEAARDMGSDPETGSYRVDLDVRMFVHRQDQASSSSSSS